MKKKIISVRNIRSIKCSYLLFTKDQNWSILTVEISLLYQIFIQGGSDRSLKAGLFIVLSLWQYDNIRNIRTRIGLMGSNFQTMTARQLAMEKSVLNVSSDTEPRVKEGWRNYYNHFLSENVSLNRHNTHSSTSTSRHVVYYYKLQFVSILLFIIWIHFVVVFIVQIFILGQGLLVLLILADKIIEIWLCLSELHLVHALAWVKCISNTSAPSWQNLPVYQWRKAFLRNIAVNCSAILLKISWIAVEFPMKVAAMGRPLGGTSHTATFTLFGIHSTK